MSADTGAEHQRVSDHAFIQTSLRRDSVARFLATISRVGAAFVVAIITARWLGPAGKGALSALLYISVLMTYFCSLGLGEASIILRGQRRVSYQDAFSSTVGYTLLAVPLGIGALWVAHAIAGWHEITDAVVIASVYVALGSLFYGLTAVENSRGRVFFTSVLNAVSAAIIVMGAVLFVAVLEFGVAGGVLASLLGVAIALTALLRSLHRAGVGFIPRFDLSFLRRALPIGAVMEGTHLLTALAERLDLLIVYWLAGEAAAGVYSVALTAGYVVSYAPTSLSYASFPRMAWERTGDDMTLRLARMAVALGVIAAAGLAMLIPVLIPTLFGRPFVPAITPALILLAAGVIAGLMTTLARAAAARGSKRTYVFSYAASLAVILVLDLLFVPAYGTLAAALASVVGACVGLAVCVYFYRRLGWRLRFADLMPGRQELHDISELLRALRRVVPISS